ncbi:MAG: nitroreductase [Pseudomonadota bacterium]
MAEANIPAFEFLATRRSRPAKTLVAPVPGRDALTELLNVASRVPDHGALVPWRFIVFAEVALRAMAQQVASRADQLGLSDDEKNKAVQVWQTSPLCVGVIHVPRVSDKIPFSEQILTGGAVCLSLVNAALAKGWGANWISGWASYDAPLAKVLGLQEGEAIAGFVHIGTATAIPPERARPQIDTLITWKEK